MKKDFVMWQGREVYKTVPLELTKEQVYTHLVDSKGKTYPRIRWGEEGHGDEGTCHDCATKPGWIHGDGCDIERCPKCHGQLLSCGCDLPQKSNGVKA